MKSAPTISTKSKCFPCGVLKYSALASAFAAFPFGVLKYFYPTEDFAIQEVSSPQISESFKAPSDVDQFSSNKGWKANSLGESSEGMGCNSEVMNVWIEKNYSNEDHEVVPLGDTCNSSLDLSGFSERYSICTKEFIQVQMTAEHLHKEHDITGGFTDNIEDCQKFIEAAGIKFIKDETFLVEH